MKTLCYELIFKHNGWMYNEGFLIIKIGEKNKILEAEGLLTSDYLKITIGEADFNIEIYSLYDLEMKSEFEDEKEIILLENTKKPMILTFKSTVPLDELEFPFYFKFEVSGTDDFLELKTTNFIKNFKEKEEDLKKFKQNVLNGERI